MNTVDSILSRMEARLAHHREQAEIHTRQEAFHREERERHERQVEELTRGIEAFRASAGVALELAGSPPDDDRDVDTGGERVLTRLVRKLIAGKGMDERFGPEGLTEEVNRRFPEILREPARMRQVSDALRRLARSGRIRQVRRGRPHHEALYVRERAGSSG